LGDFKRFQISRPKKMQIQDVRKIVVEIFPEEAWIGGLSFFFHSVNGISKIEHTIFIQLLVRRAIDLIPASHYGITTSYQPFIIFLNQRPVFGLVGRFRGFRKPSQGLSIVAVPPWGCQTVDWFLKAY